MSILKLSEQSDKHSRADQKLKNESSAILSVPKSAAKKNSMLVNANIIICSIKISFLLLLLSPYKSHGDEDYAIELHSYGDIEVAGITSLKSEQRNTVRSCGRKTTRTTLHSIDARFFEDPVPIQQPSYRPVTRQFFSQSLIDHIWALKESGERRSVLLQLRYPVYRYSYTRTYRIKRPVCCFCQSGSYDFRGVESIDTHYDPVVTFIDDPTKHDNKTKAELKWDINNPEADNNDCTTYLISLWKGITNTEGSHTSGPELRYSPEPLKLLTPFSYTDFSGSLMSPDTSPLHFHDENLIFPVDWSFSTTATSPVISANIRITGQLLHLYEHTESGLKKKEEPTQLNRYEFLTTEGSMDLVIWGIPGDASPWAWEYRAKQSDQRAIRFVRIVGGRKKTEQPEPAEEDRPLPREVPEQTPSLEYLCHYKLYAIPEESENDNEPCKVADESRLSSMLALFLSLSLSKAASHFRLTPATGILH